MTIVMPFHLRRRSRVEPAAALLVPSREPRELLAFCVCLGLDPQGRVFDVAEGFLLELERPAIGPMPGAVRLRAVAPALYVPVDAELVPSLLDDEARGLVRDWGLVFPPGGGALLYDHHAPVDLKDVLNGQPQPRRGWQSLPGPRPLAERVSEIALKRPDPPADELYDEFKRTIEGSESTRPGLRGGEDDKSRAAEREGSGGRPSDQTDAEADQAGQPAPTQDGDDRSALGSVGSAFQAMFAQMGHAFVTIKDKAQWEWVDHSHLLRKLLHEFRDGDPAKALQRALPLMPPDEPAVPGRLTKLPWSKAIYNLSDLLHRRRPGRGEANSMLHAEPSLVTVLAEEYRKFAQRAAEQGDFRRAAYIHGYLLRDDRRAAGVLQRGGLHHDAALIYLQKLNDLPAAAQAFEAAGEVDRAIELYRQIGRHEAAGDLLRRIGEEEVALAEYRVAAGLFAGEFPPDHLAAGKLWLEKIRNAECAVEQYRRGWARRPEGNAVLCALELARFHAQQGSVEPVIALLDEADRLFEGPGQPFNAFFYNEVTRLASLPSLAARADDLRDRVLESMAGRLRQGVTAGQPAHELVSALLAKSRLWPAPVLSDAEFAAGAAAKEARARASAPKRELLLHGRQMSGIVTAVCQAADTGELFVGFASGRVVSFRAERDQLVTVTENTDPVVALSADAEGKTLVVLCQSGSMAVVTCFRRMADGSMRRRPDVHFSTGTDFWLTSILPWGTARLVGLGEGRELLVIDAASGLIRQRATIALETWAPPGSAILLPGGRSTGPAEKPLTVFTHDGPRWMVCDVHSTPRSTPFRWQPAIPETSSLRSLSIASRYVPPNLDVLGLDKSGAVHSAQFHFEDGMLELTADRMATIPGGYLAAAHAGANRIVAIGPQQVDWLDANTDRLLPGRTVDLRLPSAVACFNSAATRETLVVCADGFIGRVVAPGRSNVIHR